MTSHRAFFGDGEKLFAFPSHSLITELEHKTGYGIGALYRRFRTEDFAFLDLVEVIRLGLIGGGTSPAEADRLVRVYTLDRPIAETVALADEIIAALWFGVEEAAAVVNQAAASSDMAAALNEALEPVAP